MEDVQLAQKANAPLVEFDEHEAGRLASALGSPKRRDRQLAEIAFLAWLAQLRPSSEATRFLLRFVEVPGKQIERERTLSPSADASVATLLRFGYPHALQIDPLDLLAHRRNSRSRWLKPLKNPSVVAGLVIAFELAMVGTFFWLTQA
jgi:hypothetical protein